MKSFLLFLFSVLFLFSCSNSDSSSEKENTNEPKDELDAALAFIKATLNGKYAEARNYILTDSTNMQYSDVMERAYDRLDRNKKEEYKQASIQDIKKEPLNDSVCYVNYMNSYEKQHYQLKMIHTNNQWLVDLKHTFQNKPDSLR